MRSLIALLLLVVIAASACGSRSASESARQPSTVYVNPPTRTLVVPSSSMEPTLHCAAPASGCLGAVADGVVVQPVTPSVLRRGDIVAVQVPELAKERCGADGIFLKRIIGLPGETWEERHGYVFIDGKKLNEPYIKPDRRDFQTQRRLKLGSDRYFLMGDNRASSCDSRVWGSVPGESIVGHVTKILRAR